MVNENKFLDATGVQHLWSKISMEDYPNNETLIAVINAIDESKADKDTLNDYYLKTEADNLHIEVLEYVDTEIAALVNAAPETLDTIGELAAAFKENQDMVQTLNEAVTYKKNIPNVITSAASNLLLSDNTEYYLTNISSLNLSYPNGNFEVWMNISLSSTGTIAITFPSSTSFIGVAPVFGNNQTWEISIKNGVTVCWRVK